MLSFQKIEGADDAILDDVNADGYGNLLACGFKSTPGTTGKRFLGSGKVSSTGALKWVYFEGLSTNDHIRMAMPGPDGHIYLSGDVQGTSYNPYVAKLDTSGTLIWDLILTSPWNDELKIQF